MNGSVVLTRQVAAFGAVIVMALGASAGVAGAVPTTTIPAATTRVATTTATTRPKPTTTPPKPTVKPTTPPPATAPKIAPIPAGTAPASTLPLQTRQPSAHVSSVFPILSAVGFSLVLLMLAVQWVLTRPGRRGWTL